MSDNFSDDSVFDVESFKREIEEHKATGWRNLPLDQKLFICRYIKDGHSIVPMTTAEYNRVEIEEAQAYVRNPMVQAAIADVSKQYAEITTFTKTGIQARLARALDMAMGEIPTYIPMKDGGSILAKSVNHSAIAKYLMMAKEIADMADDDRIDEAAPWAIEDDD